MKNSRSLKEAFNSQPDPGRRPLTFSIVSTDREPGKGYWTPYKWGLIRKPGFRSIINQFFGRRHSEVTAPVSCYCLIIVAAVIVLWLGALYRFRCFFCCSR